MNDNDGRKRESQGSDKGRNLGQGLANISDKDRHDQAGTGTDRAPTQDQRQAPASRDADADGGRG